VSDRKFAEFIRDDLLPLLETENDKRAQLEAGGQTQSFRIRKSYLTRNLKKIYGNHINASKASTWLINSLKQKYPNYFTGKRGFTHFEAPSYGSVNNWKRLVAKDPEFLEVLGGQDGELFSKAFELGHGSTSSLASIEYRQAEALKTYLDSGFSDAAIDAVFEKSSAARKSGGMEGLRGLADTAFDANGDISKEFVVWLDIQTKADNRQEGPKEKKRNELVKRKLQAEMLRLASSTSASPSVEKYVNKAIDNAIEGVRYKVSPSKSRTKKNTKPRKQKKKKLVTPTLATIKARHKQAETKAKKAIVTNRLQDPRGRFTSLVNVTSMINSLLHGQLKENMKPPALVYRSGRFASSVRVTQMNFTREGQITAFYEYMKRPYQTFERGFKQGNEFRDPRRLIDKSIREVAEMYIHKKFDLRTRRM